MFKRYNINELYIAEIARCFIFSYDGHRELVDGGIVILRKIAENRYVNIANGVMVPYNRMPISCFISYIEPLSNYYTQDGKKLTKKQALNTLDECSKIFGEISGEKGKIKILK